jgi:hypothetical protein
MPRSRRSSAPRGGGRAKGSSSSPRRTSPARGARSHRQRAHQQVRRGLSRGAATTAAAKCRRGRVARHRTRQASLRRRARQRAAALRHIGQHGGLLRHAAAGRHPARHGSRLRRPPHARPSAVVLGARLPRRRLRRRPRQRAHRFRRSARLALEHRPKLVVCGASAYSRTIDFARFREIADEAGALLMADIAHIAGLVAAGLHPSPVPHCDFVTSTTHKTLRGPRGGVVLCRERFAKEIDRAVFPGMQGGPLDARHRRQGGRVRRGAGARVRGLPAARGGQRRAAGARARRRPASASSPAAPTTTSSSPIVAPRGVTGALAETALDRAAITVNKNTIPFDRATRRSSPRASASARRR